MKIYPDFPADLKGQIMINNDSLLDWGPRFRQTHITSSGLYDALIPTPRRSYSKYVGVGVDVDLRVVYKPQAPEKITSNGIGSIYLFL